MGIGGKLVKNGRKLDINQLKIGGNWWKVGWKIDPKLVENWISIQQKLVRNWLNSAKIQPNFQLKLIWSNLVLIQSISIHFQYQIQFQLADVTNPQPKLVNAMTTQINNFQTSRLIDTLTFKKIQSRINESINELKLKKCKFRIDSDLIEWICKWGDGYFKQCHLAAAFVH